MKFLKSPALKIIVAVALFGLISLKVDIAEAGRRMLDLPVRYIVGASAGSFVALLIQACKTRILLRATSIMSLFRVSVISQFYAMVFFGQVGGDVAKTAYLLRVNEAPHKVVAAVLFDRITGLVGLVILGLLGLAGQVQFFDGQVALALTIILAGLLAGMISLFFLSRPGSTRIFSLVPEKPRAHLQETLGAIRAFSTDATTLIASILMGIVFQGVIIVNCAWLASGLGIDLSLATWAAVMCVMSLVLLLPVSIGGIGLRDVTLVGMLGTVGVATELALAMSFALLGLQLVMAAAGGFLAALPVASVRSS